MSPTGTRPPHDDEIEEPTAAPDAAGVHDGVPDDDIEVLDVEVVEDGDDVPGAQGSDEPDEVDPRMRQRWVDQQRAEGRRRLRILAGVGAFVVVALLAYALARSSLLGVDTVTVAGNQRVPVARIVAAARVADGSPTLFVDTGAVARRIERLPGIARATVDTELPSTVTIRVVERVPLAWADAPAPNPVAVLDATGTVIERVATPPAGLLRVVGVHAGALGTRVPRSPSLQVLAQMPLRLRLLADRFGPGVSGPELVLRPGAAIGSVRFGDATEVARKGAVVLALLDDLTARGQRLTYVDVTAPEAPVTSVPVGR